MKFSILNEPQDVARAVVRLLALLPADMSLAVGADEDNEDIEASQLSYSLDEWAGRALGGEEQHEAACRTSVLLPANVE